jgi:uncharacterized hydantoinase/oxoprolinase family protein
MYNVIYNRYTRSICNHVGLNSAFLVAGLAIELIWAQVKGFVAENNTTFHLKDVKELVYGGFGRITKEVWAKAEDHVLKIEKEYGKENCIDRSVEKKREIINFHNY